MKRLIVHAVVAAVALAAAFAAYRHGRTSPTEGADDEDPELVVASISRQDLKGVLYESESRSVSIDLSPAEPPYWVTVVTTTKTKRRRPTPRPAEVARLDGGAAADGGSLADGSPEADAGVPEEALAATDGGMEAIVDGGLEAGDGGADDAGYIVRETKQRFVANERLDDLLKSLAPLKVVRRIGKVAASRLEEFELDEAESRLTLKLRQGERVLKVGGRTFGGGDHYAFDEQTQEVYLLSSKVVRDIELAQSRLVQRRLHRFEITDVASAVIIVGGERRTIEQRNRQAPRDRTWVDASGSESGAEQVNNWMRQLERLRALSYPDAEDQPSGEPTPLVRVEYRGEDGSELGFAEIFLHGEPGPGSEYLGRSEATGVWVSLARTVAEQIVEDLPELFGSGEASVPESSPEGDAAPR